MARNQDLPGMEDRSIRAIEQLAHDWVEIRDRKKTITAEENDVKDRLVAAMRKHNKEFYKRDGIEIRLENKVNVNVKVRRQGQDDDESDVNVVAH